MNSYTLYKIETKVQLFFLSNLFFHSFSQNYQAMISLQYTKSIEDSVISNGYFKNSKKQNTIKA
jgi:hypothetical protein